MWFGPVTRQAHPLAAGTCGVAGTVIVISAFHAWLGSAGFVRAVESGGLLLAGIGLMTGFILYNAFLLAQHLRR